MKKTRAEFLYGLIVNDYYISNHPTGCIIPWIDELYDIAEGLGDYEKENSEKPSDESIVQDASSKRQD